MKDGNLNLIKAKIKECSDKTEIEEGYFIEVARNNADVFSGSLDSEDDSEDNSEDEETEELLDILDDEAGRYIEFRDFCNGKSTSVSAEDRLDTIYDKVYELCSLITDDKDLECDMEYLGEIADFVADIMVKYTGKSVYFPWYDEEGKEHDYYFG